MKRISVPCSLALLFVLFALASPQERLLTLEDIYHPQQRITFEGTVPIGFRWLSDGDHYLERIDDSRSPLVKVAAMTGERTPFFEAARLRAVFDRLPDVNRDEAKKTVQDASFIISPDESALLMYQGRDIYYYNISEDRLLRLTNSPALEKESQFSPDGQKVAFVRDNNLYAVDVHRAVEEQFTKDGSEKLLNGLLDWVYQEEVYGRGQYRAFWWSPDSRYIAFLQLDESRVPTFPIVAQIDKEARVEETFYPRPGDPNPAVRLGVVSLETGQTQWVIRDSDDESDMLIVRVGWRPDSRAVIYEVQNREQTWLDLNAFDVGAKTVRRLLREESKAWVNVIDLPTWLKDGSFLWRSDREGRTQVLHLRAEGKPIRTVTPVEWKVDKLFGVDERGGWVYFSSTQETGVDTYVYRTPLAGGAPTRLTSAAGNHDPDFSPTFSLFLDTWSDIDTPTRALLTTAEGRVVRPVTQEKESRLKEFRLSHPEFLKVKTSDGFLLDACMIKPLDFDRSRRYPVLISTYAGPEAPTVRNEWGGRGYLWHQLLAQKGYVIFAIDPRSSSGRAVSLAWPLHKNLGELELRDLEESVSWLKTQPYIDGARIGIWGWSYGGYITAYALTHSHSFKVGIVGAPVTDWRLYDSIYTERYMGLPSQNQEGYDRSSVLKAAKNLDGRLLLLHGLIDDNVHLENSVQLIYELQKAGKQFDVMFYPNSRHGVAMPALVYHMRQLMTDFILKNL